MDDVRWQVMEGLKEQNLQNSDYAKMIVNALPTFKGRQPNRNISNIF